MGMVKTMPITNPEHSRKQVKLVEQVVQGARQPEQVKPVCAREGVKPDPPTTTLTPYQCDIYAMGQQIPTGQT